MASDSSHWATAVHPELGAEQALELLTSELIEVCRLAEPDPRAAWEARLAELDDVRGHLAELALDAVRFDGPGTELTVGLLPGSRWRVAQFSTVEGVRHTVNLPTEELFTTPDPERTTGFVTATRPLYVSERLVTGLRVRFEAGRAVEIDADEGADTLRGISRRDPGAARLGELALVDRDSHVGRLDTVFFDALLDENAVSHVALGEAYGFCVEGEDDRARMNRSEIHVDFMLGGEDVEVTGIRRDGSELSLLQGGVWQA